MHKSILNKAFEGKLLPQDPNDEPAEILLQRIKKRELSSKAIHIKILTENDAR